MHALVTIYPDVAHDGAVSLPSVRDTILSIALELIPGDPASLPSLIPPSSWTVLTRPVPSHTHRPTPQAPLQFLRFSILEDGLRNELCDYSQRILPNTYHRFSVTKYYPPRHDKTLSPDPIATTRLHSPPDPTATPPPAPEVTVEDIRKLRLQLAALPLTAFSPLGPSTNITPSPTLTDTLLNILRFCSSLAPPPATSFPSPTVPPIAFPPLPPQAQFLTPLLHSLSLDIAHIRADGFCGIHLLPILLRLPPLPCLAAARHLSDTLFLLGLPSILTPHDPTLPHSTPDTTNHYSTLLSASTTLSAPELLTHLPPSPGSPPHTISLPDLHLALSSYLSRPSHTSRTTSEVDFSTFLTHYLPPNTALLIIIIHDPASPLSPTTPVSLQLLHASSPAPYLVSLDLPTDNDNDADDDDNMDDGPPKSLSLADIQSLSLSHCHLILSTPTPHFDLILPTTYAHYISSLLHSPLPTDLPDYSRSPYAIPSDLPSLPSSPYRHHPPPVAAWYPPCTAEHLSANSTPPPPAPAAPPTSAPTTRSSKKPKSS